MKRMIWIVSLILGMTFSVSSFASEELDPTCGRTSLKQAYPEYVSRVQASNKDRSFLKSVVTGYRDRKNGFSTSINGTVAEGIFSSMSDVETQIVIVEGSEFHIKESRHIFCIVDVLISETDCRFIVKSNGSIESP